MPTELSTEIARRACLVAEQLGQTVSPCDVVAFVDDLLYGMRQLASCLDAQLVTPSEVANALADRLAMWLVRNGAAEPDVAAWDGFVASATALLGANQL